MNPDRIRELLDGITAGEWERIGLLGNPGDGYRIGVSVAGVGWETTRIPQDHEMMAASPGIARYALELAERLAEYVQRDVCIWHSPPEVTDAGGHCRTERCRNARYALAPQPAPTDGAG